MARMDTVVKTQQSGLLDVTVSSILSREKFTHDMVIACEVSLPGTPHYVREELTTFQHSMLTSRYTSGCSLVNISILFNIVSIFIFIITWVDDAIIYHSSYKFWISWKLKKVIKSFQLRDLVRVKTEKSKKQTREKFLSTRANIIVRK